MEARQYSQYELISPAQASMRAREFIRNLGKTPHEKATKLKELYPVRYYDDIIRPGKVEKVPYIMSHSVDETKGKPTVVIFSGVFQEVREMPIELATIAHVFDVPTIVIDYASLAHKGMDHFPEKLRHMLEHFEYDKNPPRIFIGESLGGIVAQTVAFMGAEQTNMKGLLLSHTIPPELLDKSLYLLLKTLKYVTPAIPMPIARKIIEGAVNNARNQVIEGEAEEMSMELREVHRLLRKENGALTRRRGNGFLRAATDSVDISRKAEKNRLTCVEVIASPEDTVLGYKDEAEWRRFHPNANLTSLPGTEGHFKAWLRKERVLVDTLIPLLTKVLAAAV